MMLIVHGVVVRIQTVRSTCKRTTRPSSSLVWPLLRMAKALILHAFRCMRRRANAGDANAATSVLGVIVCRQEALSRVPTWVLRLGPQLDHRRFVHRRTGLKGSSLTLLRCRTHRTTPARPLQTVPMREPPPPPPPPMPWMLTLASVMALLLGSWLLRLLPLSLLAYSRGHHHHHRHRHRHHRRRHHRQYRHHRHCLQASGPYLRLTLAH